MQRYVDNIAKYTNKPKDIVRKDVGRNRYFSAKQAIEYGLVDHEITKKGNRVIEKRDYEGALQKSEAQNHPRRSTGGGPSADAGY
jgi:ClpP class serine protease